MPLKNVSVILLRDSEDFYYERRMKFTKDRHFLA